MTKRLVDLDDDLLELAQAAAGADTIKGTVTQALEQLVDRHRRREAELHERWAAMGEILVDLDDDEVMRRAWS